MRFRAVYGNRVDTVYGAGQSAELVDVWRDELGSFDPSDIRAALDALRFAYVDYPPTLYQFAALCRDAMRARSQSVAKVTHIRYGQPSPEILAAIHELTKDPLRRKTGPRDWARKILQREANGERLPIYALTSSREVLGIGEQLTHGGNHATP